MGILLDVFSNVEGLIYKGVLYWGEFMLTAKVMITSASPKAEAASCVGQVSGNFY